MPLCFMPASASPSNSAYCWALRPLDSRDPSLRLADVRDVSRDHGAVRTRQPASINRPPHSRNRKRERIDRRPDAHQSEGQDGKGVEELEGSERNGSSGRTRTKLPFCKSLMSRMLLKTRVTEISHIQQISLISQILVQNLVQNSPFA
jgi:hypothetical protein